MPFSDFRPFVVLERAAELSAEDLQILRYPVALMADPRTTLIKRGFAGRFVGRLRLGGGERIVKLFDESALKHRLLRLIAGSAALRTKLGKERMRSAGFRAPRVLAVLQSPFWSGRMGSCLVSEFIEGSRGDELWEWIEGRARVRFIVRLADHVKRMHGAGLYPQDIGMWNWIVPPAPEGGLVLVDLDRVRCYHRLPWRRRAKNLIQLARSFGYTATAAEKRLFLRRYLGVKRGERLEQVVARLTHALAVKERRKLRQRSRRSAAPTSDLAT